MMKGLLVTAPNVAFIGEIAKPEPRPGHALVRIIYGGICGGDPSQIVRNYFRGTPEAPKIQGHEYFGQIEEINNPFGVATRVKVGDYVVGPQYEPCYSCDRCMDGRFNLCERTSDLKLRPNGCFCEYAERSLNLLFPIPPDVDQHVAALAEPLAVGVYMVRRSDLRLGDSVLVIGAGVIGLLIGLVARLNGASRVIYAEVSEKRIALAKALGFEAYNSAKDDLETILLKRTGGKGIDIAFEAAGTQFGFDLVPKIIRHGGALLPVGFSKKDVIVDMGLVVKKEINIIDANIHNPEDFRDSVYLICSGKISHHLKRLVTSVWPLDLAKEAVDASTNKDGDDLKILIQPGLDRVVRLT